MSFNGWLSNDEGGQQDRVAPAAGSRFEAGVDPEMEHVLRTFRESVHAWSDAVYERPRLVGTGLYRLAWRRAATWALGSVLVVGGVGSGVIEYHYRQERTRLNAVREVQRQGQLREERAREAELELAQVDRAVSREVPDALEPLAGLMNGDENQ